MSAVHGEQSVSGLASGVLSLDRDDWDESLSAAFERVVAVRGAHIAVCSETWTATYDELNAMANRVAHALIARGAPDDRIAILMQHAAPAVAAVIAIAKAGRVIVSLNPTHPAARLRELIEDSEPSLLIAGDDLRSQAEQIAGSHCTVAGFEELAAQPANHNPAVQVPGTAVAVLAYTSGSTGRPKAVMMTHRQLRRNAAVHSEAINCGADDRISMLSSLSGGQGITTPWIAMLNGAALFPFPIMVKGVTGLADWMTRHDITIYASSASIFRNFVKTLRADQRFPAIRVVRLSSEPVTSDDFAKFRTHFPHGCCFAQTLSSTETGVIAWSRRPFSDAVADGRLPIGRIARMQQVLIRDEKDSPAGPNEAGEIVVRSRYLSSGYWRNPELSAERFEDPGDLTGERLFRTGDIGRIDGDGVLHFLGRNDQRVKIRGNRIELSEVVDALISLPGVEQAVADAVPRPHHEPELVGYVVPRTGYAIEPARLRLALREIRPDHMIPSALVVVEKFPLTPTGKVDRESLRRLLPTRRKEVELSELPQTETEAIVAKLWSEAFEIPAVSRTDDFYDLGGDSLIAAVVSARLHEALGLDVQIAAFFDHPVLADFADLMDRLQADRGARAAFPARRDLQDTPLPLSFGQEFYWRTSLSPEETSPHVFTNHFHLKGPIQPGLLQDCINAMAERHEILRTSFSSVDGRACQIVEPHVPLPLAFHDLAGAADAAAQARLLLTQATKQPFDIARPPLVRFTLFRLGENDYLLSKTGHHIMSDGWSWNIFFRELGRLYEAKLGQRSDPGLEPPCQYADYALWERETFASDRPRYRDELAWWMDYLLAATHPTRRLYANALVWCIRTAPPLPRVVKRTLGKFFRGLFWIPPPARNDLPFRRTNSVHGLDPTEGLLRLTIAPDISKRLFDLGRREGATNFTVRLAAYAALLANETGNSEVCVGTYFRNLAIARDTIGFCANHAILALTADGRRSFRELVAAVRDRLRAVQGHSDFPFEALQRELRTWSVRLPQIRSNVSVATPHGGIDFAGVHLTRIRGSYMSAMPPGFDVRFGRQNGRDECEVQFDAHVYDSARVRAFIALLVGTLDVASREPDLAIDKAIALARRHGKAVPQGAHEIETLVGQA
jgi:amino acid adenylation domain-containing protein